MTNGRYRLHLTRDGQPREPVDLKYDETVSAAADRFTPSPQVAALHDLAREQPKIDAARLAEMAGHLLDPFDLAFPPRYTLA